MQRTVYILFSLLISLAVYATKVDLQPSSSTWHTAMPNDTLYISQKGSYRVKISQIGKYHIEQTINDTIDFKLQANNIKDEKVKNGLSSNDTLQISFKNIQTKNIQAYNDFYALAFEKDTCNINLLFEGAILLAEINQGSTKPHIYVSGKSPHFNFNASKANFIVNRPSEEGLCNALIETKLSPKDTLVYQLGGLEFNPHMHRNVTIAHMIKNNYGYVSVKASKLTCGIRQAKTSELHLCNNSHIELNDYTFHNAVITAGSKIYIDNATLQTTNDLTFIESADTIFIDETTGNTTINATIGSKRNPLNETKYSRVVVNKASYIKEITAMTDVYNANIDALCPSPQVKDTLSHADINVYGGKIKLLTNNIYRCEHINQVIANMGNRIINVYHTKLTSSSAPIRLGHSSLIEVRDAKFLCYNDTLNLYGGNITVPKGKELIRIYDNTLINIHHKNNNSKITSIQYHPQGKLRDWSSIELKGGVNDGDSTHWNIGDIDQIGIKSSSTLLNGAVHQPLRIVYRNSNNLTDSLVIGVHKDSTHYIKNYIAQNDIVDVYTARLRNIHYVNTLDETWQHKDSTYREGFGKASLPKVIYAGKTFKGWFTEPEGGIKVDSISHLQTGDITLYTQWGPGQDIIYSDFDRNVPSNMGGNIARYVADENNTIDYNILPLEDNNTFAIRNRFVQNEEEPFISFFLRTDRRDMYKTDHPLYVDLRHTTGVSFYHKGSAVDLYICTKTTGHSYKHKYVITEHNELTLVNIPWGQFSNQSTFDLENIFKLTYHPQGERGEFWLDNIIFTKGEIYPIEKITLDTVPNQYLFTKNPDLLDIPLPTPKDSTKLFLYPKFTPSDATYQAVTWSSKDASIATVDEYGRVNAISHGQTYIYCQSVMHPEVKDSILVGVAQGGIYYNLNGVSISNQLPTKYDYEHPVAIPAPQPINDFYTFHGWHTDSITGAVVDSASYYQFGNLKAHTLYAEFTREIPGAAITIMQNRIVAVQNPNNYDALKEARYVWKFNNQALPSQKMFVEVGRPIPEGTYHVTMHIDDEMPIQLERYIDATINQDTDNNFTLYPNPIKAGNLAYLIGRYDSITLFDMNGQPINTPISDNGIITAPMQTGMYVLKIIVDNNTYSIKFIVI